MTSEEREVETADQHARLILETANDAYISIDEHGTIVDWNRSAERILGWPAAEALGRPLAETVIPERFRAAHYAGIAHLQATGEGPVLFRTVELPALHRDGSELPAELTIWPSRLGEQRRFNAFLRDVSDRTRMQANFELLQRVTEAANAAEELEDAVRTALEGVASLTGWLVGHAYVRGWEQARLSPTGWWTEGSSAFPRFRAATEETVFAPGTGLPGRVVEHARPAFITDLDRDANFPRAAAARQDGLRSAFAFPIVSGTRVVAVLEFYCNAPDSPDEELTDLMGNIGVQLGRVFERLRWRGELQEALESKSRLLSLLAHEVRTPVVVIEGFADLLLEELGELDPNDVQDYLTAIRQHAARMQRLTANTLRLSRLEAGRQHADRRPVPVDDFLARVVRGLDVPDVEIGGETGLVAEVDPDHLEQILTNYLTNAASYGAPPIRVDVSEGGPIAGRRSSVVIRVCDRGEGVPSSFVPELFRDFRRGTSGGSGSGLGLSIVRQLAELNGGAAWHEPLRPTGAAFAIQLPQASPDAG